jgi:hypothetical protein
MAETTAATLKTLPTKSFTSTTNTWEGLQTFKDEVRIESSSDNGAVVRKLCDKLKVGETPSVGQNIMMELDCTKDYYFLHNRCVYVTNNNDVSYVENIIPNLKYSSLEEREKYVFPIIRAVIDNSSNAGISIGASKEEYEKLGTTWINLYGDVYLHGKLRIEAIHGDFKKGDKTPVDYGTGTSDVNEIWSNRIYSSDSSNNLIVNENYQIISKAQFTNPNTGALSSFTNPTTYHRVIYPNVSNSNANYHIAESYYLNTDGALYCRFGGGSGYTNKTVFDVYGSMSIRGKAQCPTAPTADADLVNLSYLKNSGKLYYGFPNYNAAYSILESYAYRSSYIASNYEYVLIDPATTNYNYTFYVYINNLCVFKYREDVGEDWDHQPCILKLSPGYQISIKSGSYIGSYVNFKDACLNQLAVIPIY